MAHQRVLKKGLGTVGDGFRVKKSNFEGHGRGLRGLRPGAWSSAMGSQEQIRGLEIYPRGLRIGQDI